jgi:hypothetical protein
MINPPSIFKKVKQVVVWECARLGPKKEALEGRLDERGVHYRLVKIFERDDIRQRELEWKERGIREWRKDERSKGFMDILQEKYHQDVTATTDKLRVDADLATAIKLDASSRRSHVR